MPEYQKINVYMIIFYILSTTPCDRMSAIESCQRESILWKTDVALSFYTTIKKYGQKKKGSEFGFDSD